MLQDAKHTRFLNSLLYGRGISEDRPNLKDSRTWVSSWHAAKFGQSWVTLADRRDDVNSVSH